MYYRPRYHERAKLLLQLARSELYCGPEGGEIGQG